MHKPLLLTTGLLFGLNAWAVVPSNNRPETAALPCK